MARRFRTSVAALLLLGASSWAQVNLWSWDGGTQVDLINVVPAPCAARNVCTPPAPNPFVGHPFPFGGADYDSATDTLWVTDGMTIANIDRNCRIRCSQNVGAMVFTGLAVDSVRRRVYTADTNGFITMWTIGGACLTLPVRCPIPNPLVPPVTGLAYDAFADEIFGVDALGLIVKFSPIGPAGCMFRCEARIQCPAPGAAGRPTGMTYDSCARVLYIVTEPPPGSILPVVVTQPLTPAAPCGLTRSCCAVPNTSSQPTGLAIRPQQPGNCGSGCVPSVCSPACTPAIGYTGQPTIGTIGFSITLSGAPSPGSAWLFLGFGPCTSLNLGLCGPVCVFLGPPSPLIFPVALGGPAGCNGAASIPLSPPFSPLLCGFPLSAQWVGTCGSPAALWLSNALCFVLTGP